MTYFLKALDLLWCAWSLNDEKIGLGQGLTECLMNVREWTASIRATAALYWGFESIAHSTSHFAINVCSFLGRSWRTWGVLHGWSKFDISLRVCNAACCGRFCPKFAQALAWLGPWSDNLHLLFAHYLVGKDESTLAIDLHPCHQLRVGFHYHCTAHNGTVMSSGPWSPKQLLVSNALGLWDVFVSTFFTWIRHVFCSESESYVI